METLAQALGVTKSGFSGRPALLAEILDTWERMSTDEVIADPVDRVIKSAARPIMGQCLVC